MECRCDSRNTRRDFYAVPGPRSIAPADLFVTKLSPDAGSMLYSTYLGGDCASRVSGIALDRSGNAYLGVSTMRSSAAPLVFPLAAPFEFDPACGYAAVAGLNAAGSSLLFSSWIDVAGAPSVAMNGASPLYAAGNGCVASMVGVGGGTMSPGRTGYLARIDLATQTGPSIDRIVDAFTGTTGAVTPGELLRIESAGIRPDAPVDRGMNPPSPLEPVLSGVRVWFDNVPAPVMSVAPGVAYVMAPSPVGQRTSARVVAESGGVRTNPLVVLAAASRPAPLDTVRNDDGSVNLPSHPAPRGSVVTFYATGLGVTDPPFVDGTLGADPPAHPAALVTVTLGGIAGELLNVSTIPGFVAGIFQIQVRIPANVPASDANVSFIFGRRCVCDRTAGGGAVKVTAARAPAPRRHRTD